MTSVLRCPTKQEKKKLFKGAASIAVWTGIFCMYGVWYFYAQGVSRWKSGMLEHQELGPLCIKILLPLKACFPWLNVPVRLKGISEPEHFIKPLAWKLVKASSTQEHVQEHRLPLGSRHLHAEPKAAPRLSACRCRGDQHPKVDSPHQNSRLRKKALPTMQTVTLKTDLCCAPFSFFYDLENKPWTYVRTCPFHSLEVSLPSHVCVVF